MSTQTVRAFAQTLRTESAAVKESIDTYYCSDPTLATRVERLAVNTATALEQLSDLIDAGVGAVGPAGPRGDTGPAGPTGDTGPTGATGGS